MPAPKTLDDNTDAYSILAACSGIVATVFPDASAFNITDQPAYPATLVRGLFN
jgi:hypothetical protein